MDLNHMDLEDLKIDPEFEAEIPPLTEDEFDLLKQNILSEGRLLSPLIIWNGTSPFRDGDVGEDTDQFNSVIYSCFMLITPFFQTDPC